MAGNETYIYVITMEGTAFRKIGVSANVEKRLRQLQTGNPSALKVERHHELPSMKTAAAVEARIHRALSPCQKSGEWFSTDSETVRLVYWEAIEWAERHFRFVDQEGNYPLEMYTDHFGNTFVDRTPWPKGEFRL